MGLNYSRPEPCYHGYGDQPPAKRPCICRRRSSLMRSPRITSDIINDYWTRYESCHLQLHTFIQLKVLFSGLIEMMILLDRLVFLQESIPTASSYLVALFDPIKSPRRWCLISLKEKDI
ncbi:unnamed protein product [Adineta steineri]|uniref:Uncharacterized protein n=1 Tax=Adineta steineri TaxID=433720 RepID=A0A815CW59_9BILA|nr:unnamed protein product [Adineta steineri]